MKFLTLPLFLLIVSSVLSQSITIKLSNNSEPIALYQSFLITPGKDTLFSTTDFNGITSYDSLSKGSYNLKFPRRLGFEFGRMKTVEIKDTNRVYLEISPRNCPVNYTIKPCPIDHKKNHVIRVNYELRVSYSYRSKWKQKRYIRKVKRQGFRTFNWNGDEILLMVENPNQHKMLQESTSCDQFLFCKQHKKVFQ